jgi:glycosyltransferase involved in cell wall biosynthesis
MKLVVQIPCFNEESHLPSTLAALPQTVPGIETVQVLVVDDGSTDRTADIARALGATVVRVPRNRGLANAFMVGLEASLEMGADVIVNTDADNQYFGADIASLVAPVLAGSADVVIGARPIADIAAFSPQKKILQRLGSGVVRLVSGTSVSDATSGFRAISRDAALQASIFSRYTYTLESIVQAAQRGLRVISVPIRVNAATRASRLSTGDVSYLWRAGSGLVRILVVYRPFRSFMLPAILLFAIATVTALRFLYYFLEGDGGAGHIQSLIFAAILYGLSGALMAVAFLGDLLAINRRLLEEIRLDMRRIKFATRRRQPSDE